MCSVAPALILLAISSEIDTVFTGQTQLCMHNGKSLGGGVWGQTRLSPPEEFFDKTGVSISTWKNMLKKCCANDCITSCESEVRVCMA